ncbi:hypothetical protein C476_08798 [Natrinema limicola JCM 13563]|uniref:Uncharacterized protein n=2 Tax=Natrinema limicola TaxID=370323 RepID=M0CDC7_9EURY|nr:hypothetical protein C476_08798 [Natrinema limicola JCM 13563]
MMAETVHDRIGTGRDEHTTVQLPTTVLNRAGRWAIVASWLAWLQARAGVQSATERHEDLLTSP